MAYPCLNSTFRSGIADERTFKRMREWNCLRITETNCFTIPQKEFLEAHFPRLCWAPRSEMLKNSLGWKNAGFSGEIFGGFLEKYWWWKNCHKKWDETGAFPGSNWCRFSHKKFLEDSGVILSGVPLRIPSRVTSVNSSRNYFCGLL